MPNSRFSVPQIPRRSSRVRCRRERFGAMPLRQKWVPCCTLAVDFQSGCGGRLQNGDVLRLAPTQTPVREYPLDGRGRRNRHFPKTPLPSRARQDIFETCPIRDGSGWRRNLEHGGTDEEGSLGDRRPRGDGRNRIRPRGGGAPTKNSIEPLIFDVSVFCNSASMARTRAQQRGLHAEKFIAAS